LVAGKEHGMPQKEKIGDFLIGIGSMTVEQRDDVLKRQGDGDRRLFGEIARELDYVDKRAIERYLGL
jgi:hypothetical protein